LATPLRAHPRAKLHDFGVDKEEFLSAVLDGLARPQKCLPCKFFYDERGSHLFEEITHLPEYYLTRTERALLERWMPEWMRAAAPRTVVELGAGSGEKTRILLEAVLGVAGTAGYVPVDVSAEFLAGAAAAIAAEYPALRVEPVVADIAAPFDLPTGLPRPALHAFLGSTIGNFAPAAAVRLLGGVSRRMGAEDRFLMGVDLRKDPAVVEAAYNDAAGVTAAFNLNMLRVVNALAGTDFDPEGWEHRAFYDTDAHQIEMRLVARRPQVVRVPGGGRFHFGAGDAIRTEISAKHDRASVEAMLAPAELALERWETDPQGLYALALARPT
jgi:L-histidine Nalpha-methyltransferase